MKLIEPVFAPKLFSLRLSTSSKPVPDLFFPSKQAAKAERDKRNKDGSGTYVVTLGPDHYRFKA